MVNDSLLRRVALFADLPDADLKRVATIAQNRNYRKQEVIFHAEDAGTSLFILKSGAVKIAATDRNGREIILKLLYPGDFFGEMALLDGQHRSATVTAVEKVEALVIQQEDFLRLIKDHPELNLTMLLTACRRLRHTDEKVKSLVFADAYGKVAQTLLRLMQEKGQRGKDGMVLDIPFSQEELAHMVGITRQTLSRVLREYQQAGVLKLGKRRILILDEARIQREALC